MIRPVVNTVLLPANESSFTGGSDILLECKCQTKSVNSHYLERCLLFVLFQVDFPPYSTNVSLSLTCHLDFLVRGKELLQLSSTRMEFIL